MRAIPKSRYSPQFNGDALSKSIDENKIKYFHFLKLGGLRKAKKNSVNTGWKNLYFRGFADYMQTPDFSDGLNDLIKMSRTKTTTIMCVEAVPGDVIVL
ncbi:MAG: DUF488 domain-containing protein [Nanoarchaeota archaeon]|nr:DUF488 domain-containing protein [Nanoarchaeota archaeon]